MDPKVTLIEWPHWPMETVYTLWESSRTVEDFLTPEKLSIDRKYDSELDARIIDIFERVCAMKIPVAENLNFTFILDNVSIALREQLVRHRIGVKVGDRLGVDIVPDLQSSTWWSQTMRVMDMGQFADKSHYVIPSSMQPGSSQYYAYGNAMRRAQDTYNTLVNAGVPKEDARMVIPLAATHRISWTLNLASIMHIIGNRSCWIAQLGLWAPIAIGMANELRDKVDPVFAKFIAPPCVCNGEYNACVFDLENVRRLTGEDMIPPCALWLQKQTAGARAVSDASEATLWTYVESLSGFHTGDVTQLQTMQKMIVDYAALWGVSTDDLAKVLAINNPE